MAIIYSYPTVIPVEEDLILGTDISSTGKPTKNFTIQSIIDLVTVATGDLQTVLDLGNVATGRDIVLGSIAAPTSAMYAGTFSTGTANIVGTTGSLFTSFESTSFTGKLDAASFNQDNIRTVGLLTGLSVGIANADGAITKIVGDNVTNNGPMTNPGLNTNLVTEKAIVDYIASQPNPENLFQTLQAGNTAYSGGVGFNIDMGVTGTTNGNILFGDNKKIRIGDFGVTYPLELFYGGDPGPSTSTVAILQNKAGGVSGTVPLTLRSNILDLSSVGSVNPSVTPQKYLTATKYVDAASTGVLLYYNNTKKFETTATGIDVTGIMTTDNIVNPGYYNGSNGVGTSGQLLSSTVTGTNWIANPNPTPYLWKIEGDSGAITTVANADTIHFKGMNDGAIAFVGIKTAFVPGSKELRITASGFADGDGQAGEVAYWSGTGLTSTLAGDTGMTYDAATDNLTVVGVIQGGTLSDGIASINSGVGAAFKSITTTISTTANNANGFFGPLRTNAASTNYAAGVADQAVQLTGVGTINLNAGGSEVTSTSGLYKAGAAIALDVTLNNAAVIGKIIDTLVVPAAGSTIVPTDTIVQAFGKLQAEINTGATGLRYLGTWNSNMDVGGTDNTPNGTPPLFSGGGLITDGTTSTVGATITDVSKDFGATGLGVVIGDRAYNASGGFTTIAATPADGATSVSLTAAIITSVNEAYSIDNSPALTQGNYYVVNAVNATEARNATLNTIQNWQVGDWVIAGANNVWERLDQTSVEGQGTDGRIAKWTSVSGIANSIMDETAAGIVLDTGKNFATVGAGTITSASTFNANGDIIMSSATGVSLPVGGYGAVGQVLTAPGTPATGTPLVWSTPTTGVVESISGLYGITVAGTAAIPTIAITADASNLIKLATIKATPVGADTILINDSENSNVLKQVELTSIKTITAESWDLNVDGGTAIPVADTQEVDFLSGTGIVQSLSTRDVTTALRYEDVNNDPATGALNFIDATGTAVAPVATDYLIFSDQFNTSTKNVVKRATIADIVDLGNETLAQVLVNDNVTGGTDIAVSAADDITFTDTSKAIFGTTSDMNIFHNGTDGYIDDTTGGSLRISSDSLVLENYHATPASREYYLNAVTGGDVQMYADGKLRLKTTSAANGGGFSGGIEVVNEHVDNPATIKIIQDTKVFTITTGISGNPELHTTGGLISLKSDSGVGFKNANGSLSRATFGTSHYFYPSNAAGTGVVSGFRVLQSTDATSAGTLCRVYGDLQVDGSIIHGGGGGGTAKGGTFTNLFTTQTGARTAFTISRATSGAMAFDVWLTSDTSATTSVAKKFTIVKSHATAPIVYKILDTGPDGATIDFTVDFSVGANDLTCLCEITPVTTTVQKIGITIDLGFGQYDATVVMPAT